MPLCEQEWTHLVAEDYYDPHATTSFQVGVAEKHDGKESEGVVIGIVTLDGGLYIYIYIYIYISLIT